MQKFQNNFKTRKRSFISVFFLICVSVPLTVKASIKVSIRLISEKTKFVPLKSFYTRLELLICVFFSKLISEMCSAFSSQLLIGNRISWTNSEVALCWTLGKEKKLEVMGRV